MERNGDSESRLLDLLVRATTGNLIDSEVALPAVARLLADGKSEAPVGGTAEELLGLLARYEGEEFGQLRTRIQSKRLSEALRFHREGPAGDPGNFAFYLGHLPQTIAPQWDLGCKELRATIGKGSSAAEGLAFLKGEELLGDFPSFTSTLWRALDDSAQQL